MSHIQKLYHSFNHHHYIIQMTLFPFLWRMSGGGVTRDEIVERLMQSASVGNLDDVKKYGSKYVDNPIPFLLVFYSEFYLN